MFLCKALLTALATASLMLPAVSAVDCKQYNYQLVARGYPMKVTKDLPQRQPDGTITISETWQYMNQGLPNYDIIKVDTIYASNPPLSTVYLYDTGGPRHTTVFQLARENGNTDAYTIPGNGDTCDFQYSGVGSRIANIRVYTVN